MAAAEYFLNGFVNGVVRSQVDFIRASCLLNSEATFSSVIGSLFFRKDQVKRLKDRQCCGAFIFRSSLISLILHVEQDSGWPIFLILSVGTALVSLFVSYIYCIYILFLFFYIFRQQTSWARLRSRSPLQELWPTKCPPVSQTVSEPQLSLLYPRPNSVAS